MHYFLFVRLQGLYVREVGLAESIAVVHRNGVVIDVSEAACARQVSRARTLKEAKLILGGTGTFVDAKSHDFEKAQARWLRRGLKFTSIIQPVSECAAFFDLSPHPKPDDIAAQFLSDLHREEGLAIEAAVAPTKWLAELAVTRCEALPLYMGILPIFPVREPRTWLSQRSTQDLIPLPPEVIERLIRLGARKVFDVQRMSLPVLSAQFGKVGLRIHAAAQGLLRDAVVPEWPKASRSCEVILNGCENEEELMKAIQAVARECALTLSDSDQEAGTFRLYLHMEDGKVCQFERTPKRALRSASMIATHLLQFRKECPVESPIERLRVLMLDLQPARRRQPALTTLESKDASALVSAEARLKSAFGEQAVVRASELSISRDKKVLRAWGTVYGWS